jgi:WhiB family transcriptional regulator, redox-sensing transcriptional regulator
MITAPRWMDSAGCAGLPTDWFFPDRGGSGLAVRAKAVCADCPVRQECLTFAVATGTADGIWGGLTPDEREIRVAA